MKKRDCFFYGALISIVLLFFACDSSPDDLVFDIATLTLELPVDSAVTSNHQPSFTWSGSGQTHYDFYLGLTKTTLAKYASELTDSQYAISGLVLQDTTYFWKVIAVSDDGFRESEIRFFTIE